MGIQEGAAALSAARASVPIESEPMLYFFFLRRRLMIQRAGRRALIREIVIGDQVIGG